jgi:putative ABC transport system permease protein
MLQHYLRITLRNMAKQKSLTIINISGLSIGLACFILFMLFGVNEMNFDRFHKNASHIYRVAEWIQGFPNRPPGGEAYGGTPLGPAMKRDFPDVKEFVRIQTGFDEKFVKAGSEVSRSKISFADPQMFSVFSFRFLDGNAATALDKPQNLVLTKDKAIQLFGGTGVVGRRVDIKIEDKFEPFTVGAVIENIPSNSSIKFGIMGSYEYLMSTEMGRQTVDNWNMSIGSETYVQLTEGSSLMNQVSRLTNFRKKYFAGEEDALKKDGIWKGSGPYPVSFLLQPLTQVHTNPKIGGMADTIDPKIIWILISIAGAILLIACINFTTLSIGRSAGRAKEIGVRKVTGSLRSPLVFQFLTESLLLSFFSAIVAYLIAQLMLPYFNELTSRQLSFSFSQFPQLSWLFVALILVTGTIAGIYPALVLSGFKPVDVLKSKIRLGGSNFFTRSLVTVQFVLSIVLIISTFIILQQLKYLRTKNLGFDKENVVLIDAEGTDTKKVYALFKEAAKSNPEIVSISASEMGMGAEQGLMGTAFDYKGETKGVVMYPVDDEFLKTMGLQLLTGRDFNAHLTTDTISSIIVNESFLGDFGLTMNNAVGQEVKEKKFGPGTTSHRIIGVIKNFNYSALKSSVGPQLFLCPAQLNARKFYVRIRPGDPAKALSALQSNWKNVATGFPFQYSFLDENFNRFYQMEERWSSVAGTAGVISIFLACLGLFGLTALTVINRTKEIGIRKILGASISTIVALLSKEFLKLVFIAIIIAVPFAWYAMYKWLQDYAYRINIEWWLFLITGLMALFIAFVTVSFQAIKAAIANPVKSLRTE